VVTYAPQALSFSDFSAHTFLADCEASRQIQYARCYLEDLGVLTVVEEPYYFDKDYLDEFASFYATSARGYRNACRRIHLFDAPRKEVRTCFATALSGDQGALDALQRAYCGFIVVRPLADSPLGRTVFKWYPDRPGPRRVTAPSREYVCNLVGLRLTVHGLAWEQQDTGVGACATVALWTLCQSSGLSDGRGVPTTAQITRLARDNWPGGALAFPATEGLGIDQIAHATRALGYRPAVLAGDQPAVDLQEPTYFTGERFSASCAAFLRSGYPVLFGARVMNGGGDLGEFHAVCCVGMRPSDARRAVPGGTIRPEDDHVTHLYVHDDNMGPNVRFRVDKVTMGSLVDVAVLRMDPPAPRLGRVASNPPSIPYSLIPCSMIVALPLEVRLSTDSLYVRAAETSALLATWIHQRWPRFEGVTYSARFFRLHEYLRSGLPGLAPRIAAKLRLALVSRVPPMSLHLGVARIGYAGIPVLDILYDTSDTDGAEPFAHVAYAQIPSFPRLGVRLAAY
jgi:hypothetical protein